MRYAYVRVSTEEQNEARQIESLKRYNIDQWFSEKISGADMNRPQLQQLLKVAESGDTIYVSDFSRLARSTYDLLMMLESFEHNGITLVSDKERVDMSTASGKLIITVLAAVNEFEREISKERQAEGIAIAKAQGKYKGRAKKSVDETLFAKNLDLYKAGKITKTLFAENIGVSRKTLYVLLEDKGIK